MVQPTPSSRSIRDRLNRASDCDSKPCDSESKLWRVRLRRVLQRVGPCAARRGGRLEPALVIGVVVLASALAMSPNVADPDLWGHVQFGRDVLSDGRIPATTSYSFTAVGYPWINHENLSEIVMAVTVDSIGPIGLVLGKFLLSLLVIGILFRWNLANGCGLVVSSIVTLLVAANLGYHWSIRPQVSSFVCFTLLILLFQYAFDGWRDRWHLPFPCRMFESDGNLEGCPTGIRERLGYRSARLRTLWLLVPLMAVWANSHGGFVAGLAVILAYLAMRGVEALCRGGNKLAARTGTQPEVVFASLRRGNAGWGLARRMALMGAVALLATFLNPYGPGLHRWLVHSLGHARPEISDWNSNPLWTLVGMKFWLLAGVATAGFALSRRRMDATHLVVLALLSWHSLSHFRHVPFFAIAAGFWLGPHLQSAIERISQAATNRQPTPRLLALVRVVLVAGLVVTSGALAHRLTNLQVERDKYPVDAIAFMRDRGLHGRLVVTYDWAQYAIAALCSDEFNTGGKSTVAFDGRFRTCYPRTIVDMHFDFLFGNSPHMPRNRDPKSGAIDPNRVLEYGRPDLVLLRRYGERTEWHMQQNADEWTLLYQDAISQVWGDRTVYDDPGAASWLAPDDRRISNFLATDSVMWPAIGSIPLITTLSPEARAREQEADSTGRGDWAVARSQTEAGAREQTRLIETSFHEYDDDNPD